MSVETAVVSSDLLRSSSISLPGKKRNETVTLTVRIVGPEIDVQEKVKKRQRRTVKNDHWYRRPLEQQAGRKRGGKPTVEGEGKSRPRPRLSSPVSGSPARTGSWGAGKGGSRGDEEKGGNGVGNNTDGSDGHAPSERDGECSTKPKAEVLKYTQVLLQALRVLAAEVIERTKKVIVAVMTMIVGVVTVEKAAEVLIFTFILELRLR
ncbi:hypothetical protein CPB84DRAFT_1751359 [Gymnopilus junonius]|uniref:Uncharacterized protein n=1 Tax=Gymnopilus junonius TaxID=109634 RepID=A0A9P5NEH6_GYMJU|nr:hypothetical protein CPB84DRAFT_1751359 [Gymnopilus junonius]